MRVEERLLKYVGFPTASVVGTGNIPSSDKIFDLARYLEDEIKKMGLEEVELDSHCYLYGKLKATSGMENAASFGLIAHMDTSPDFSGVNIKPQIIENYDGNDILLKGSGDYIKKEDFHSLETLKGRTVITTDGTTLLGADDKAGIAEILTALEEIIAGGTPHGEIWVAFTPDEEIGTGTDAFDFEKFKAGYAYTLDGGYEGELSYENFYAATAKVTAAGKNVHPGSAKNIMKNAVAIVSEFQGMLDPSMTPEKTEKREGFIHLTELNGTVESADAIYIIRDHDKALFEEKKAYMRELIKVMNIKYGKNTLGIQIKDAYANMIEIMKDHMDIVDKARKAIEASGAELREEPIRGGTDGAQLSFKGLPCPNLGTGGYGYHGPYEHISIEGMECSVRTIKYLCSNPRNQK